MSAKRLLDTRPCLAHPFPSTTCEPISRPRVDEIRVAMLPHLDEASASVRARFARPVESWTWPEFDLVLAAHPDHPGETIYVLEAVDVIDGARVGITGRLERTDGGIRVLDVQRFVDRAPEPLAS